MPFTPYHFGPSGFIGLLFRRWIDVPVFIAANVLIDIEVLADQLLAPGGAVHQLWHFHTLLIGGLAGAIFGAIIYYYIPFRWLCEKSMAGIGLPSKATPLSMILAGTFGAWLHVFIDSFYHYDVQIFWPYRDNSIFRWINGGKWSNRSETQQQVVLWCVILWILMVVLYAILVVKKRGSSRNHDESEISENISKIVNDNS